jgi:hypothetical protein
VRETTIKRLHWGCGSWCPPGWINTDRKEGPGIDISCDIREAYPWIPTASTTRLASTPCPRSHTRTWFPSCRSSGGF